MNQPRTVTEALAAAAATSRGVIAIEHDGRSVPLPYHQLLADALTLAGALHARGLTPGDRVAIVLPEVSDFIQAFFGISAAGLVPVPLCPPAQAGDLATFTRQSQHVLAAAQTAAVVTSPDVAPLLQGDECQSGSRLFFVADLLAGPSLATPIETMPDDMALLQFTSGSTAAPKGVVLSHRNIAANVDAILGPAGLDVGPDDSSVSW